MTTTLKYPLALASVFLWIGFVSAISFMEAWLKFRAPGVTIALGLEIGRLVFGALNKVEWILSLSVLANLVYVGKSMYSFKNIFYFVPFLILVLQTFWLLPDLDFRAELHIQGNVPANSNLHWYYVGMEIVKVICLFIFGIKLIKLE
ncbi:hypothetical protein [Arenibacter sp. ARW7G5Y1]|uniref:hypothetical protein n=1 Tax=Arenibacter sp. ARW7G5Y1 TaxID=2135619 RepID=UPI000D767337|nr:hypothetical protein [Arenibacter sp. ARW7G5Y1]PXX31173.1 hypothetical protein C7972_1018 [Arenibacter sp. ARW7G5Y1]